MAEEDVASIKGVGENIAKKLAVLGIYKVNDLLNYYPRRYDDFSNITSISSLKPGPVSIQATIKQITGRYVRRGMHITEAVASDESGSVRLVWFNQPYRANSTKSSQLYFIAGNFELSRGRLSIMNPSMELASNFPLNTARIVPIYRETKGLKSSLIRKLIASQRKEISQLGETLPEFILKEQELMSRSDSLLAIHFPSSRESLNQAKRRLGFEEVFGLSLASMLNKIEFSKESTHSITFNEKLARGFIAALSFELTSSQKKIAWRILLDMQKKEPMNRLIEGDVGTGKTVIAALAAVMVIDNNFQVALMAPTELLARQHAENLHKMLQSVGKEKDVALLVGSMKPTQKELVHKQIKEAEVNFIIGTHALITDKVSMSKLGLVIIDEQHRFGVNQRKLLQKKAGGRMPHVLSMTATPIPRTLALTLYGELDISVLREKPENRLPIITKIVSPNSRAQLYHKLDKELDAGHQLFVVCPLITDSDNSNASSADTIYKKLTTGPFKQRRIGLLHGRLKSHEKEQVMSNFVDRNLDILVSTTVIEVGVDVPNATVMVIEGAERFGLAQIHQLRGRVGRGNDQGYCYLMLSDSKEASRRLKALESSTDGFRLSELDLELRGPGAIYGHLQSGQLDLRIAKLTDVDLIESARESARKFINSKSRLSQYPDLELRVSSLRSVTNLN